MKTFKFIGMALFAVLMCVNIASCGSSDDDPIVETEEGGVVVSGKKIAKLRQTLDFSLTICYKNTCLSVSKQSEVGAEQQCLGAAFVCLGHRDKIRKERGQKT